MTSEDSLSALFKMAYRLLGSIEKTQRGNGYEDNRCDPSVLRRAVSRTHQEWEIDLHDVGLRSPF